ncbi:hypothetical protein K7957_05865 [Sphingomonas yunnanensis]|uniref:hypothetical protein n=1 Tax=Sphingomonas yunnanensis TaxID=310400 RepID=UPI001CA6E246|nr:hypothetical protein [Sphingomonas yunnanensis]MBY9062456.1 hypothetical protein [Sphingomonas yunnanensis]
MWYRDTLIRLREDLVDTDRAIEACKLQLPSMLARMLLDRARGLIGVAQLLVTRSLDTPTDAASPKRGSVTNESGR